MESGHILIVEDDPDVVKVASAYLKREAYEVEVARDGLTGLDLALSAPPSLIILDLMLPGIDGLEFMRRLRKEQRTSVIMLTARKEEADRILGLELGADDYLGKPFSPRELVARVKAVLRRTRQDDETEALERGSLHIDPSHRRARLGDVYLDLTRSNLTCSTRSPSLRAEYLLATNCSTGSGASLASPFRGHLGNLTAIL